MLAVTPIGGLSRKKIGVILMTLFCKLSHFINAAIFVLYMFCNFYLEKNPKIAYKIDNL
jgi:hypothetical protein